MNIYNVEFSNSYISECLLKLPHGIIECKIPRIGITYLELHTERNSIILFPHKKRALACSQNFTDCLYINEDTSKETITIYQSQVKWRKFIVTPDSLEFIIQILKEEESPYFFMIKDMEELQSESLIPYFTKTVSNVLDYYVNHPKTHRCICTIDSKAFSHPILKEEDTYVINWKHVYNRNIAIFPCRNIIRVLKETIEQISLEEKVLVIYTSVPQAKISILNLEEEFQNDCCILCNRYNEKNADKFYTELTDRLHFLPKRITFLSDNKLESKFTDSYHLITVSDTNKGNSLLSIKKIIKAYNLCEDHLKILSDTIIHNTKRCFTANWNDDIELITKRAKNIASLLNKGDELCKDDPSLKSFFSIIEKKLNDRALGTIRGRFTKISLVRKNIEDKWDTAYMNIDNLLIRINQYIQYYENFEDLSDMLKTYYTVTMSICENDKKTKQQQEIEKKENELSKKQVLDERLATLDYIEELYQADKFDIKTLDKEFRFKSYSAKKAYQEVKNLYNYIDMNELIPKLRGLKSGNNIGFKNLTNTVIFGALVEDHPFKSNIYSSFEVGSKYTNVEINEKLSSIIDHHFHEDLTNTKRKLITLFKCLFNTSRPRGEYLILSKITFSYRNRIEKDKKILFKDFKL